MQTHNLLQGAPVIVDGWERDAANDPAQSTDWLDASNEPAKIDMCAGTQQDGVDGARQAED